MTVFIGCPVSATEGKGYLQKKKTFIMIIIINNHNNATHKTWIRLRPTFPIANAPAAQPEILTELRYCVYAPMWVPPPLNFVVVSVCMYVCMCVCVWGGGVNGVLE